MKRSVGVARCGFTLLEIILTIAVLVLGVLPVVHAFSRGMITEGSMEAGAIALGLAQEKLEEMRGVSAWEDLDSYAAAKSSLGGDFSDYSREVLVSGDPKQVTVSVYWTFQGAEQAVSLVTLFTNLSP